MGSKTTTVFKHNRVPYNKFRPANIAKVKKYLEIRGQLDPVRVNYCDKKSLKGRNTYNKKKHART